MPLYLALIYSCNSVPELVSPSLCIFLAWSVVSKVILDDRISQYMADLSKKTSKFYKKGPRVLLNRDCNSLAEWPRHPRLHRDYVWKTILRIKWLSETEELKREILWVSNWTTESVWRREKWALIILTWRGSGRSAPLPEVLTEKLGKSRYIAN